MTAQPLPGRCLARWLGSLLAVLFTLGWSGLGRTAPPAVPVDQLLPLVPAETGIAVVIQNLRETSQTLANSPFKTWFERSPFAAQLLSDTDQEKLQAVETVLTSQLGVTSTEIRDDILGDAVIFAYRPGPPETPESESGLILIRPRKPELLNRLVQRINELQLESRDIRAVRTVNYHGVDYLVREKPGAGAEYLYQGDGFLAFSAQESAVRAVIDRVAKPSPVQPGLAMIAQERNLLSIWVNPRAFDAQIAAKASTVTDSREVAFLGQFRKLWSACDGLAFTLHPKQTLELAITAAFRPEAVPTELKPILLPKPARSPYWASVPDSALVAITGQVGPFAATTAFDSFLPQEKGRNLLALTEEGLGPVVGRDRFRAVLGAIGPDWVFWAESPPTAADGVLPGWTFAIRLDNADPQLPSAIEQAVELLIHLGRISYNQTHPDQIEMREQVAGVVRIRYLANETRFPPDVRPAFARVGDSLVFANHPDRVARFAVPRGPALPEQASTAAVPLLRLSASGLRHYLQAHHETLARLLAHWTGSPVETIDRQLTSLAEALSPFERFELVRRSRKLGEREIVTLAVTTTFVQPLAE